MMVLLDASGHPTTARSSSLALLNPARVWEGVEGDASELSGVVAELLKPVLPSDGFCDFGQAKRHP